MVLFLKGLIFILLSLHGHALSTIGVSQPACKTVSAVISPTPSSAICGFSGTSYALAGAGTIVAYTAGSPYVASLQACSAQCLANTACTNIYFIQGTSCNLHFGPDAFNNGVGVGSIFFQFYDRSCFVCGAASTPTTSVPVLSAACRTVSGVISPTPSGATCGANGSSYSLTGAGIISGYVAGSIYVSSMAVCAALCLSTVTCTNIYFIQGSNCNLHYGPKAFNNGIGNPLFQYYDMSCFTCPAVSATTTSSSNTLSTSSTSALSTSAKVAALLPKAANYVRIITQWRLEDMASIKEAAFRDKMSKWVDFMVMNKVDAFDLDGEKVLLSYEDIDIGKTIDAATTFSAEDKDGLKTWSKDYTDSNTVQNHQTIIDTLNDATTKLNGTPGCI
jgi:hypothetical protein